MKEMTQAKGVDIKEIGELNRQRVMEAYKNIDTLVAPSREDAMPIVCAEAAMNSCCVICSKNNGFSELISDCKNGLVFETDDVSSLTQKIRYVFENRNHAREMGKELRKVYEKEFTISVFERNVKEMLNLYGDKIG